ncbi:hypothetical protein [Paraburkholderia sp. BL21I4N1]|uniref:hypothetical protein n=1 Tax=Paraburkholderia sp. BL21I4N1 TaxID=1938801 RepID=UPI000CFDC116|nr:hypothetical protein [Paraburkholderia sp. BL21I4N1]PQV48584.1 hypothetical protein B0G83_108111 [Paraburkholderia sp. BL21I4N1]
MAKKQTLQVAPQALGNATSTEIYAAYAALTDDDWRELNKTGRWLLGGTEFSETFDLINEAIERMASGRRAWRLTVAFPIALAMCMKSIASHSRHDMKARRERYCSLEDLAEAIGESNSASPSQEEALAAAERFRERAIAVDKERASMAGDLACKLVFNGIIHGLTAQEIRQRHTLSHAEYKAARQRAMRRIERIFGPTPGSRPEPARSRPKPAAQSPMHLENEITRAKHGCQRPRRS